MALLWASVGGTTGNCHQAEFGLLASLTITIPHYFCSLSDGIPGVGPSNVQHVAMRHVPALSSMETRYAGRISS